MKSLVVGVHDGLRYLPYALASIVGLRGVDEIILVLDRCQPLEAYLQIIKRHLPEAIILVKNWHRWIHSPCETFQYGLSYASGDILYVSAEDIVLDPANFNDDYWLDPEVGMVDFRYYQHDPFHFNFHVKWDSLLLKASDRLFGYGTVRSGIYGVRRRVFEAVGGLKDSPTEEDWLRRDVINAGYRHLHVKSTRNLHLRPSYDRERQLMQGRSRWQQGFPLWRVVGHSMLHFKPYVLKGYLACRG